MVAGHRGAQCGHGVMEAEAVAGEGVGVPLADDGEVLILDGLCGHVEAVKQFALEEQGVLGRVEVLGVVFGVDDSSAECHHATLSIPDGEHQAIPECVVRAVTLLPHLGQSHFTQEVEGDASAHQMGHQVLPALRGEPQAKRALGFFVVTPLDKSGSSFCSSGRSQGRHKEVLCSLHDVKHGSAIRSLLPSSGRGRNFDPGHVRALSDRFDERHLVVLHQVREAVSTGTAGEAFVPPFSMPFVDPK